MSKICTFLLIFSVTCAAAQVNFNSHVVENDFQRSSFSVAKDMDNDGDIDIIATAFNGDEIAWFENDGNQNFSKHVMASNFDGAYALDASDIDNDGDIDVWAQAFNAGAYSLFINNGNQTFSEYTFMSLFGVVTAFAYDMDGDLDLDFTYFDYTNNVIKWYEHTDNLNFTTHTISFDLANNIIWFLDDLDQDGDLDLLTSDPTYTNFSWQENINGQSFTPHASTFVADSGAYLFGGDHHDIDGDGDLDILTLSQSLSKIYWYENDGTQNYTKHEIDAQINTPFTLSALNLDNDNDIDLVATGYNDDDVVWYENDGSQNFTKRSFGVSIDGPLGHSLIDLDNDSDIDVVVNGYLEHNLLWFENTSTSTNVDNNVYSAPNLGDHNYVYTIAPQKEMTVIDNNTVKINSDVIESVGYFDGLGRPLQQVAIRAGGLGQDLITPISYDGFGRKAQEHLPFTESTNIGEKLRIDVRATVNGFYKSKYPTDFENTPEEEINPYSEKIFEASPLNRVQEQAAPGDSWKADAASDTDNTIKFEYDTNILGEVRLFEVVFNDTLNTEEPSLIETGTYALNQLHKTITKDENWKPSQTNINDHTTEEFKDKQGMVVLKRTYNNNIAHDTYYAYDEFNNLTFVIPSKAADNSTINQTILDDLGYQYKYDYRNRLIEKKIPGKGWEYIVYDNLERPVLTQDANLRAITNGPNWLFTKYDGLGRVVYTGKFTDSRDRKTIQNTEFTGKTTLQNFESKLANGVTSTAGIEYSNANYPNTSLEVLSVNYYDNYDFAGVPFTDAQIPFAVFDDFSSNKTKGLATGSKVKVLETTNWITTVSYYDDKSRPIYIYSNNTFLGTTDVISSDIDFVGRVLKTRTSHIYGSEAELVTLDTFIYDQAGRLLKQVQCIGGSTLEDDCGAQGADGLQDTLVTTESVNPGTTKTIEATNTIILKPGFIAKPIAGQTVEVKVGAQGNISGSQIELIAENSYDELGQLVNKKVGNVESAALQNIAYNYNVRGWLLNINNEAGATNSIGLGANDLFGFQINYDKVASGAIPLYNGNISQTLWQSDNTDNSQKKYTYGYDALNRITSGIDNTGYYNLNAISYDKNGNIEALQRQGGIVITPDLAANTGFGNMDDLDYTYDAGNKLQSVAEINGGNATFGFKDGASLTTEYTYDINGNMLTDANKGITGINYNHLNLPTQVTINGQNISYIYDATGVKQRKIVGSTTTNYAGNYVYENNVLQFFNHAEGYVTPSTNNNFNYIFQYKDHLGNIRLSYVDSDGNGTISQSEIVEEKNYYPFGLSHKGYNNVTNPGGNSTANRYGYNGKELQDEIVGSSSLDWYDYGARNYDASLGKWMNMDPLADKYTNLSPYSYVANNVINAIDPDGRLIIFVGGLITSRGYLDQTPLGMSGFYENDENSFRYWRNYNGKSNAFGQFADNVDIFTRAYNDDNHLFISGSSHYRSKAGRRHDEGIRKAKRFYERYKDGKIDLKDGETIKIVSHSQGGAHAAGFAEQLLTYKENGKSLFNVEIIWYLNPHQPGGIKHPKGVTGIQYSLYRDAISSSPPLWMQIFNGGSLLSLIKGINEYYLGDIFSEEAAGKPGLNRGGHNNTDNRDDYVKTLNSFCKKNPSKCKEIDIEKND